MHGTERMLWHRLKRLQSERRARERQKMHPIPFYENERVIAPPEGKHTEWGGLRVADITYSDGSRSVVSCWEFSEEDLRQVMKTGRVFVCVAGTTSQPLYLSTNMSDFGLEEKNG
jgi:hypothetical protein